MNNYNDGTGKWHGQTIAKLKELEIIDEPDVYCLYAS